MESVGAGGAGVRQYLLKDCPWLPWVLLLHVGWFVFLLHDAGLEDAIVLTGLSLSAFVGVPLVAWWRAYQ